MLLFRKNGSLDTLHDNRFLIRVVERCVRRRRKNTVMSGRLLINGESQKLAN